jgi:Flp pilus assembly protein TadB
MPYYISPPPQNPLARLITAIIAVFTLVGAFMLGMAALLVVAGVALITGILIWLRVVWIKRRLRKSGVNLDAVVDTSRKSGHVIDAEYTVISDSQDQNNK